MTASISACAFFWIEGHLVIAPMKVRIMQAGVSEPPSTRPPPMKESLWVEKLRVSRSSNILSMSDEGPEGPPFFSVARRARTCLYIP